MGKLKNKKKIELGDWQTPPDLALKACQILLEDGIRPASIIEPTCGRGSFIFAALETFQFAKHCFGLDISDEYLAETIKKIQPFQNRITASITQGDFFSFSWEKQIASMPDPLLVIGNPPWVTNSGIGSIGGRNLPKKSNFQNMKGLDAVTGKSNFDISEWMIISMLNHLRGRDACLAMLCKTTVARKILLHGRKNQMPLEWCSIYKINAQQHFDVAVDACLFVAKLGRKTPAIHCKIYSDLNHNSFEHLAAFEKNRLISDIALYEKSKHLAADKDEPFKWRSGIKHDCAKIMELRKENNCFRNGLGEKVELEEEYLFPMLKSSDLANGEIASINRYMLVPQHFVGQQTGIIKHNSPKTWNYLQKHSDRLDGRISVIYRGNPQFSIFGVGDYTFTDWKIAISGFYKNIRFRLISPYEDKPVVFDDTCYFLSCRSKEEAMVLYEILSSQAAEEFFSAYIWWDSKRPITLEILNMLSLVKLAGFYGKNALIENIRQNKESHQLIMF